MKKLLVFTLLVLGSAVVLAQSPNKAERQTNINSKNRVKVKTKTVPMPVENQSPEVELAPAALEIAQQVSVGSFPCELGAVVSLTADDKAPGYFNVHTKQKKYRMFPVVTTTGAIRLEDPKAGAVWLQLANKSMLMNHKLGKRMADACMSADQIVVAESLRQKPAPGLLDVAAEYAIK